MLKIALLLSLLTVIACGKQPEIDPHGIGTRIQFQETAMENEQEIFNLKLICDAIEYKSNHAVIGSQYTFAYAQKNCADDGLKAGADVQVRLDKLGEIFIFSSINQPSFAFTEVESSKSGAMLQACDDYRSGRSPRSSYIATNRDAVWLATVVTPGCKPDNEHLCVQFKRGSNVGNTDYEIHSWETIKFKIKNERKGFFVERSLITTGECAKNQKMERSASLK